LLSAVRRYLGCYGSGNTALDGSHDGSVVVACSEGVGGVGTVRVSVLESTSVKSCATGSSISQDGRSLEAVDVKVGAVLDSTHNVSIEVWTKTRYDTLIGHGEGAVRVDVLHVGRSDSVDAVVGSRA
jgi:hypothetical protein